MARRDFRQLGWRTASCGAGARRARGWSSLDASPRLAGAGGDRGWHLCQPGRRALYPLLTYVKLLLLQQWYGLSDEGLEAAVDDRLRPSLRGHSAGRELSRTTARSGAFASSWRKRGLADKLLAEVNRQLDAKGPILRRGTLIDATILDAAVRPPGGDAGEVSPRDPQAGWTKKTARAGSATRLMPRSTRAAGSCARWSTTPADVHDSVPADDLVQGDEQAVYADKAYDSACAADGAARAGDRAADHAQGAAQPAAQAVADWFNKAVAPIRAGVERLFATMKRTYGYRRMRYLGLARNDVQLQTGRRHQSAPGARPWVGLREQFVRCEAGRAKRSGKDELTADLKHRWRPAPPETGSACGGQPT